MTGIRSQSERGLRTEPEAARPSDSAPALGESGAGVSDERDDVAADPSPPERSRSALAASTLRALRAGKPGGATPADTAGEVERDESVQPTDAGDSTEHDIEAPTENSARSGTGGADVAQTDDAATDVAESDIVGKGLDNTDEVVAPEHEPVVEPDPADQAAADQAAADETAADETVADEAATVKTAAPARTARRPLLTAGCAVLAVAALVFAVVAGVTWWTAGHSDRHQLGVARDQVAADARLAVVTVNTSDYRHPSAALSNWLMVSTGSLHSQFEQSRTAAVKLLAQAQTVTRATVLADAVTALDLSKGTASVIASVNVTRLHDGKSSLVRNRFRATLMRTGGQWKLSNLAVVQGALS